LKVNETGAYSNNSNPGTPPAPLTPGSENTPIQEGGVLLYPYGRKAVKRRAKEKVANPVLDVTTK